MKNIYIGVDVGGTNIKLGFFNEYGEIICKCSIPARKENSGSEVLPDVAEAVLNKISEMGIEKSKVSGLGLGLPGQVIDESWVVECVNLGWGRTEAAKILRSLTGIENIKALNDANGAALGEMWRGSGRGCDNFFMITLGTGIGGGFISGCKILNGISGSTGEIGHILVNSNETEICTCGKTGCMEQYASANGFVGQTKKAMNEAGVKTCLYAIKDLKAEDIFKAAQEDDSFSVKMRERLFKYLGTGIGQIAQVADPDLFIIGGGMAGAGAILIEGIKKYYEKSVMESLRGKEFRLAQLGNDAGIYGCAKSVLDK